MIYALAPLALGLAACQTDPYGPPGTPEPYPAPNPGPTPSAGEQGNYRAIGTEPFWDLAIGRNLVFTDRGNNVEVVQPTPPAQTGIAGDTYTTRRIRLNIVHARCSDGMSDRTYPDTVQVTVDGRLYRGCGASAAFFVEVDERGNPQLVSAQPGPVTTLERTRWRVTRINGRPVPRQGDYHIDFDSGRIAAKFGCNAISGPYSQTGTTLDAGTLASTRMACPNMAVETQASAILDQVMTIDITARNRLTLASSAGTIDLVRR
ncbi:MAG: META domain-containing protein [Sphingomonas bacterium]|nr:META domain-containing protein [Sphingomonas bacterium]